MSFCRLDQQRFYADREKWPNGVQIPQILPSPQFVPFPASQTFGLQSPHVLLFQPQVIPGFGMSQQQPHSFPGYILTNQSALQGSSLPYCTPFIPPMSQKPELTAPSAFVPIQEEKLASNKTVMTPGNSSSKSLPIKKIQKKKPIKRQDFQETKMASFDEDKPVQPVRNVSLSGRPRREPRNPNDYFKKAKFEESGQGNSQEIEPVDISRSFLNGEQRLAIKFSQYGRKHPLPQKTGKKKGIIPDGIAGSFMMYNETWNFEVNYKQTEICDDGVERVCLEWVVTNETSKVRHSVVETPAQAVKRDTRGVTLCNSVFREALELRAKDYERILEEERHGTGDFDRERMLTLQKQIEALRPQRFSEGPLLFGLRHQTPQDRLICEELASTDILSSEVSSNETVKLPDQSSPEEIARLPESEVSTATTTVNEVQVPSVNEVQVPFENSKDEHGNEN